MKNVFLVDADETLLDFPADEKKGLLIALQRHGVPLKDGVYERFHVINGGLWKLLERGEITRERLIVKRFELLFSEYQILLNAEQFSLDYFSVLAESGTPYAGAVAFLQKLNELGRVYIVTNGSSIVQHGRLKNAGVLPYVDGVFISDEIGFYKPSARYAEYVEGAIEHYERENAVWIGDSLSSDCACAKEKGIDFILYAPNGAPEGYDGLIARDYSSLLKMIKTEVLWKR